MSGWSSRYSGWAVLLTAASLLWGGADWAQAEDIYVRNRPFEQIIYVDSEPYAPLTAYTRALRVRGQLTTQGRIVLSFEPAVSAGFAAALRDFSGKRVWSEVAMGMSDDLAGFVKAVGEAVTDVCDGAIKVMDEAEKAWSEVEKAGDRVFGTAPESGSEESSEEREVSDGREEKYQSLLETSGSLLGSLQKLEKISGDDLGSRDLEEIRSELKGHSPADKELDELFENNADELLSFTQEMVDGMSELLSDFKEIEEMMKDDQSSGGDAGSDGEAAEGMVSIYVNAAGKSADELSKLSLYTWNDDAVRGTSALSGGDGWDSTLITPERTEDGLAVFRLGIVNKGGQFSFIVRTEGNAAQSADLTARASSEPVLVTWDAESSGRGSATQPVPVNPEDIAGEVKARTESLFSELKAALK